MPPLLSLALPLRKASVRSLGMLAVVGVCSLASLALGLQAQEKTGPAPAQTTPPVNAKPKLTQAELEAQFKETLTKATLSGRWCAIQNGKLSPEKEDKYTIVSVAKLGGDAWIVNARIQYGNKDFVAPIPVQVKWAGDTPVLTLDDVGVPGGQSYSARVLIHGKTYAGSWSGGEHAGLLNGIIVKSNDAKSNDAKSNDAKSNDAKSNDAKSNDAKD
jgi:hypothetical protein